MVILCGVRGVSWSVRAGHGCWAAGRLVPHIVGWQSSFCISYVRNGADFSGRAGCRCCAPSNVAGGVCEMDRVSPFVPVPALPFAAATPALHLSTSRRRTLTGPLRPPRWPSDSCGPPRSSRCMREVPHVPTTRGQRRSRRPPLAVGGEPPPRPPWWRWGSRVATARQ